MLDFFVCHCNTFAAQNLCFIESLQFYTNRIIASFTKKHPMKKFQILLLAFFAILISNAVLSQDTTRYEVYDVVYLVDGRILKGQILSYDSQLGGISFRDMHNRVYNFSREEYKYFLEKQNFPVNNKKSKALRERKSDGIRYSLGLNSTYLYGLEKIEGDALNDRLDTRGFALGVQGTIGKYFTRSHYFGASGEVGVFATQPRFYNFGLRYNYEYDLKQSNLARYIPIELKYQNMILENTGIDYTIVTPSSYYAGKYYPKTEFSSIFFSVGHGFGFILKQGGSFNIELSYQRHLTLSQKFYDLKPEDAEGYDPKFQVNGFRLGFSLSF
jgi:hypothetical protein